MELQIRRPLGLSLNYEMANTLLKGLKLLPDTEQKSVTYTKLKKELSLIIQIWERRVKNEKIVQQQRRVIHKETKRKKKLANVKSS